MNPSSGNVLYLDVIRRRRRSRDHELLARPLEASYEISERVTPAPWWRRRIVRAQHRRIVSRVRRVAGRERRACGGDQVA